MAFNLAILKRKNKIATTKGSVKKAGRDRNGSIRVRHQGGGRKQLYRAID
jgi:ribosomal protein L2